MAIAVTAAGYLAGCSRKPRNLRAAIVGQYRLHVGTGNCSGRGIASSTLELRNNGTSEQRDNFSDGSQFVTAGKWQLENDTGIAIENLRVTSTGEIDKNASPIHASLIVEWSKTPNILLNPHDDCLFAKAD